MSRRLDKLSSEQEQFLREGIYYHINNNQNIDCTMCQIVRSSKEDIGLVLALILEHSLDNL